MQRFLSAYRWNMDRYAWLMGHADVPVGSGVEGVISLMPQENQSQPLPVAKMDHFDFGGQWYRWDRKLFARPDGHYIPQTNWAPESAPL